MSEGQGWLAVANDGCSTSVMLSRILPIGIMVEAIATYEDHGDATFEFLAELTEAEYDHAMLAASLGSKWLEHWAWRMRMRARRRSTS